MFDSILGFEKNNELVCPYCGRVQDCHEPDVIDACCANTICEYCERLFEYSVTVTRTYNSTRMEDVDADGTHPCVSCIHFKGCAYFDFFDLNKTEEENAMEHCVGCCCGDGGECNKHNEKLCMNYEDSYENFMG